MIVITRFVKADGPLTKSIMLGTNGALISDGSACVMSRGEAQRVLIDSPVEFADVIRELDPHQAIALGALRSDLPDHVAVVTQDRLARLNSADTASTIARTSTYIAYRPGQPAFALIDVDTKGMPADVKARVREIGGLRAALETVLPASARCSRVVRRSTSTGISRADTGESLPGSNGLHIFLLVTDGADIERFLRTLHERCWLAGFGWHMVGAGGQLLDRSLVDRMVYAPERLVFEGAPILAAPLIQGRFGREPEIHDGTPLDTVDACPPLRIVETAELEKLKARSAHALAPDRATARTRFIAEHAKRVSERAGIAEQDALRVVERQCEGVLLPDVMLPWDNDEFSGCTVRDVLADPARYTGATLADPLEGVSYGRTKAMVMRRADGTPWIHSFAHGRTIYELKHDARAVAAAVATASNDQAVEAFVRVAINADLEPDQIEALRNHAAERAGIGKRVVDAKLKAALKRQDSVKKQGERDRQAAERRDTRPQIPVPSLDAPWLPQVATLNEVLGNCDLPEPPMRNIDGVITEVQVRRIPQMHALTSQGANEAEESDTQQPATEQPLLTQLDETLSSELIEHHIDYIDGSGRSVHLPGPFVRHFLKRQDGVLPTVTAISTLPLVMGDGTILARRGLDRERGIVFRIPQAILDAVPKPVDCTPARVAAAMSFLIDEWLCDVATNYQGKCILIAAAATIIERSLLDERPAFFVSAGRRGGGKTTVLNMLMTAATGVRPSAAAWSPDAEERRKSLLSYLMGGLPAIVWDNIPRGTQIGCPHIEKACTASLYSDRRLGASEQVTVSSTSVHMFTGNNIGPRGDLASRSLQVRLEVDRPDPENREFVHADPIGWTQVNRAKILQAIYTILLGNPALHPGASEIPQTRFKAWWRLIASAVQHAAKQHAMDTNKKVRALVINEPVVSPVEVNFRDMFLRQEDDDEETASISEALAAMRAQWGGKAFAATDLARILNDRSEFQGDAERERCVTMREFLFADVPPQQVVTSKAVGKRLKRFIGDPVRVGERVLSLRSAVNSHTKVTDFYVQTS